jgi:hypothetical protein
MKVIIRNFEDESLHPRRAACQVYDLLICVVLYTCYYASCGQRYAHTIKPWRLPGLFWSLRLPCVLRMWGFLRCEKEGSDVSRLNDVLASALPVVCVVAGSSLVAVLIVVWLVHAIAVRAIEKAPPDQIAAVVAALTGLVSPLRWIWPWSGMSRRSVDNAKERPNIGGKE